MNLITLLITYLITPSQIKSQFTCPDGLNPTEFINLDGALVSNVSAITSIGAECPGTQEIDGWSYTNDGSCTSSKDKVNWYFMGALNDMSICTTPTSWNICTTPDIVAAGPGDGPTGRILGGCLQQIQFTLRGTVAATSGIFIKVYTKPQEGDIFEEGDTQNSLKCWYKSRLHIPATSFGPNTPQGATFNEFTTFTSYTLSATSGYAGAGDGDDDSNLSPNSTFQKVLDNEEIRAIAFSTSSELDASSHNFTVLDFKLTFDPSCTCPSMRTYNLAEVPGPFSGVDTTDIGGDCSDDIGTCDHCTCKHQCVHQDGVAGNSQVIDSVEDQQTCCSLCGSTDGCLAYTYIIDIDGISTECGETYAIGDCLLYDQKLTECSTDSSELRYEGVSGSIVDGNCDVDSVVGDCCADNGECIMGMCTAPTAAPTLITPNPSVSPTDSSESSEESDSSESSNSSDSSESSESYFALVNEEIDNKQMKYSIPKAEIENEKVTDMEVNLSESTWITIWAILGVFVLVNVVLILIYYGRKESTQVMPF